MGDHLSPIAVAYRWVSEIMSLAFVMALPAVGGYFLDRAWKTSPWMLIAGALLGGVTAFRQLLRLAEKAAPPRR